MRDEVREHIALDVADQDRVLGALNFKVNHHAFAGVLINLYESVTVNHDV